MGVLWLHFIFHLRWSLLLSEKRQRLWYYTMGQLLFSVFINNRYFTVYTLRLVPSELKLLKNQLNPHFLFNTLNNIDSLICSYPEKASKSLVQMSEMMRYMIYETNTPEVDLAQELKYIHNYLDLQQLQYDNPNLVSYRLEGSPDNIRVAPMLFIAFIENAFKHCTDKKAPEAIRLFFQIQKSEIHFEIFNMFDPAKQINKDSSSGIGLNIIRRRLDILYRRRYDLQINQKNGYFDVSLTIKLT